MPLDPVKGARFVSRHRNYYLCARNGETADFATGKSAVLVKPLDLQWVPKGLTDNEIEASLKILPFDGLPENGDTGIDVDAYSRLSVLDTAAEAKELRWTDEEHQEVLDFLRSHEHKGRAFIEVSPPPKTAPWKGYDSITDVYKVIQAVELTGVDPNEVVEYELENANRPDVLAALAELLLPVEEDDTLGETEDDDEDEVEDEPQIQA